MNTKMALTKVINKLGSQAELARQLNTSRGFITDWMTGRREIPARLVRKIVMLSNGEITESDLRPDVFYDYKTEEKKELSYVAA